MLAGKKYKPFEMLMDCIKTIKWDLIGYVIFTVILAIPFITIYVPVMKEGSMYAYSGFYLPELIDTLNVSEDNLMMGWFLKLINYSARGRDHELMQGYSIVFIALFIFICVDLFKYSKKKLKFEQILPKSIMISIIVCILLMIRWDKENLSLWAVVYTLLLPARAIHAVCRFLMWLTFPISVLIAYWGDGMSLFADKKKRNIIMPILIVLMFVSTINLAGVSASFNYEERKDFMAGIAPAPEDMECFYMIDTGASPEPYYYQLDAYEIALQVGKPSINGYSGHFPQGWGLDNPVAEYYEPYAQYWIENNGLQNVYTYDLATGAWAKR